jgi:transposase
MTLYVRSLLNEEGKRLSRTARKTNNAITLRRAQVILHSAQGFTPPKIADMLGLSVEWTRHIIHEFNEKGFDSLKPLPNKGGTGRPRKFVDEIRLEMVNVALTPPSSMGYPFTTWSLRKLRDAIVERGIVADISISNLQKILKDEELTYQAVKTWKQSDDPDFEKKKGRIDSLTRKKHNPPVVLSFDEAGPLQLRPVGGGHWQVGSHPDRVPISYSRKEGTRQLLLAFNYYHGTFFGRLRRRKTAKNILSFFRELRRHYPAEQRIHIIMDNLSAHSTEDIVKWAKENRVSFAPTPTNASWLNPVECHIGDIQRLALKDTNYTKWPEVDAALQSAIRYKNAHRKEMLENREKRKKDKRTARKRVIWKFRTQNSVIETRH